MDNSVALFALLFLDIQNGIEFLYKNEKYLTKF